MVADSVAEVQDKYPNLRVDIESVHDDEGLNLIVVDGELAYVGAF